MRKAGLIAGMLIVCATWYGFTKHDTPAPWCSVVANDGNMELSVHKLQSYSVEATSMRFSYNNDTMELPYCTAFRYSGSIDIGKDSNGRCRVVNTIKKLPEDTPFYFRPEVVTKLTLTGKEQKHFDRFKNKVLALVKDTGLRSSIWFELNSIESAIKNNDAVSYIIGVRQLTDLWAKTGQWYDGK